MDCRTDRCSCCCKKVDTPPPPDLDEDGCEIPSNICTKNINFATRPAPETPKDEIIKQISKPETDVKKYDHKLQSEKEYEDEDQNTAPKKEPVLVIKSRDPLVVGLSERDNVCKEEIETEEICELETDNSIQSNDNVTKDNTTEKIEAAPIKIENEDDCDPNPITSQKLPENEKNKTDDPKIKREEKSEDEDQNPAPKKNCYSKKELKDPVVVIKSHDPLVVGLSERDNVCKEDIETEEICELETDNSIQSKDHATEDNDTKKIEATPVKMETEDDCDPNLMTSQKLPENAKIEAAPVKIEAEDDCEPNLMTSQKLSENESESQSSKKEDKGTKGNKYCYSKKGPKNPVLVIASKDPLKFKLSEKDDACKDEESEAERFQKEREKPLFGEKAAESVRATVDALFAKTRDVWNGSRVNSGTSKVASVCTPMTSNSNKNLDIVDVIGNEYDKAIHRIKNHICKFRD